MDIDGYRRIKGEEKGEMYVERGSSSEDEDLPSKVPSHLRSLWDKRMQLLHQHIQRMQQLRQRRRRFAFFEVHASYVYCDGGGDRSPGSVAYRGMANIETDVKLYKKGHRFEGVASQVKLPWRKKTLSRRVTKDRDNEPYLKGFDFGYKTSVYLVRILPENKVLNDLMKKGRYIDSPWWRVDESDRERFNEAEASIYENDTGILDTDPKYLKPHNLV